MYDDRSDSATKKLKYASDDAGAVPIAVYAGLRNGDPRDPATSRPGRS
ncbi:hypothetical protein [Streptomyces sp. NPDC057690]